MGTRHATLATLVRASTLLTSSTATRADPVAGRRTTASVRAIVFAVETVSWAGGIKGRRSATKASVAAICGVALGSRISPHPTVAAHGAYYAGPVHWPAAERIVRRAAQRPAMAVRLPVKMEAERPATQAVETPVKPTTGRPTRPVLKEAVARKADVRGRRGRGRVVGLKAVLRTAAVTMQVRRALRPVVVGTNEAMPRGRTLGTSGSYGRMTLWI